MDKLSDLVLNKANIGIIVVDRELKIVYLNKWLQDYAGINTDDIIGQLVTEIMPIFHKSYYQQLVANAFLKGQSMFCSGAIHTNFIRHQNHLVEATARQNMLIEPIQFGEETYLLLQIKDTSSQHKQIQLLKNEIAERKRIEAILRASEEEMKELRDRALAASKAKTEFMAVMSHEIRTPMNAIIGMADLLADTPLDTEQSEYVEILKYSSLNLLQTINDILDVSKIEAGKLENNKFEFNLQLLLDELVSFYTFQAEQKGLQFLYKQANVPAVVEGDSVHIKQAISNLLSNAIKFTEQGYVSLEIRCTEQDERQIKLEFWIKDTGIGVAEDKMNYIFEPFSQADSSTTRKFGGTGLGLAIVKRLIESMGGVVAMENNDGQGAIFKGHIILDAIIE
jgi:signal transduction histidine kinase